MTEPFHMQEYRLPRTRWATGGAGAACAGGRKSGGGL